MTDKELIITSLKEYIKLFLVLNMDVKSFIISNLSGDESLDHREITRFCNKIFDRINSRGPLDTISWLKGIRVIVYSWIAGRPENPGSISTYRDGLPRALGPLVSHLRKRNNSGIRLILSLLNISREIESWKLPDVNPIEKEPGYTQTIRKDYKCNIRILLNRLHLSNNSTPLWTNNHYTTKSGPSGPAMLSADHDLKALSETMKSHMRILGGHEFTDYIQFQDLHSKTFTFKKEIEESKIGNLRKLSVVKDTEGKSRIIAMADYWTQDVMFPLHKKLLNELRSIKSDVTFGQDIGEFGNEDHNYWSFDLTSATDRLPIFLYEDILEERFGKEYQESWTTLMIRNGFHWKTGFVFYKTGQPMGIYSSWALLAHAHHCIVQWAAHKIGLNQFWDYRLLGDDIVIRHDLVAQEYQLIMSQLGVSISPTKTLVSKDTFEFAKRLFSRGCEMTGFPLNGLRSSLKTSWMDVCNIVETSERRGFIRTWLEKDFRILKEFYKCVNVNTGLARVNYKHILTHYGVTHSVSDMTYKCARMWKLPVTCVTDRNTIYTSLRRQYLIQLYKMATDSAKRLEDIINGINQKTGKDIATRTRLYDNPPKSISHLRNRNSLEPIEGVVVEKWIAIKSLPTPNPTRSKDIESDIKLYEELDLRVPDPFILDRSRNFERKYKVKASASVRALKHMCDSITSDYDPSKLQSAEERKAKLMERLLDLKVL